MTRAARLILIVISACASVWSARAARIGLAGFSNGTYTYDLYLPAHTQISFIAGNMVQLTGLSSVTGATAYPDFAASFTSASVTLIERTTNTFVNGLDFEAPFFLISLQSNVSIVGSINFAINGSTTDFGSASGPVSPAITAAPEPSSPLLISTGLAAVAIAARFQLRQVQTT